MKTFKRQVLLIKFALLGIFLPVVLKAQTDQTVTAGSSTLPINFPAGNCAYSWTNDNPSIGISTSGIGDIPSFAATNNTNAPIKATITATPISKEYAYIPNSTSGTVSVVDSYTQTVVATITTGVAPIGVAISANNKHVYITDIVTGTISFIDATTNTVSATVSGASAPIGIAITPDGKYIYVANSQSNDIWKINTTTRAVTPIPATHPSEVMVMSPDGSKVYAIHSGVVTVISTISDTVIDNIPIDPITTFFAVISPDGNELYIGSTTPSFITIVNTATRNVSLMGGAGLGVVSGMALSPDGKTLYVALSRTTISSDGTKLNVNYAGLRTVWTVDVPTRIGRPNGGLNIYFDHVTSLSLSSDGLKLFVTHKNPTTLRTGVAIVNTAIFKTTGNLAGGIIGEIAVGSDPIPIGNFVASAVICGPPITYTITVNPAPVPPTISTTGAPSALSTVYGTPSSSTSFTVSGNNLTAGIIITPPAGFEVSADDGIYNNTITIGSTGSVTSVPVYIRLKQTTVVGTYSGNIGIQSSGTSITTQSMPASSVLPALLTVTADSKSKIYGEVNPPLTLSYSGFVNSEDHTQLTILPAATTTVTQTSPVGTYPITVSGGNAPNYRFNYINGVFTVNPPPIKIPNTFTPNGDGINDTWNIVNLNAYPKITVEVLNRYGSRVYFSNGYSTAWDGSFNAAQVPFGVYYYIITGVNKTPLSGYVTVLR